MKLATSVGAGGTAQHGKSKGRPAAGALTAEALIALLSTDARAQQALAGLVMQQLLQGNFAAQVVRASAQLASASRARGPGTRLAGTVSTLAGAITGPTPGSAPCVAMVFLQGAATAVACYVPPHIVSDLATGQDVWVEPVNGSISDLMIVAVRGETATPVAAQALTNAATAQTAANNAQSTANTALADATSHSGKMTMLAAPYQFANGVSITTGGTSYTMTGGSTGVPTDARAVLINGYLTGAATEDALLWYPNAGGTGQFVWTFGYTQVVSQYTAGQGWVGVDASGDLKVVASNGACTLTAWIVGYLE